MEAIQPKFFPEGLPPPHIRKIYMLMSCLIHIYSRKGVLCSKMTSGSVKRSSVSALEQGTPLYLFVVN